MTTPSKIGRYDVIAELGRGGMATVFRAYDPRFKREVALKLLPPQFTHDPMFRARFEREAETIAALEHPAIVPVYDFGEEADQPYLVMRLMTGGSLADRLDQGPLPIDESAKVLERIGSALDRAHELGVIHRDLKPGNILFDQYGDAFLADFGIARLAEASATLTGSGIVGTPAYMSPEQIQGGELDGRSDIYALGIILFEMLTGQKPYQADTPAMLLVKQMTEPVPRILDVKPDLSPEFEPLLSRAMAKQMEDRYNRASELSQTLTAISRGQVIPPQLGAQEGPPATPEALTQSPTKPAVTDGLETAAKSRTVPWRWLIAVSALLLLLFGYLAARTFFTGAEVADTGGSSATTAAAGQSQETDPPTQAGVITVDNVRQLASRTPMGRGSIESTALSPDGNLFAVGGSLGVWLYEVDSLEPLTLLSGHQGVVSALAWSPGGEQIASASWDQTIRIWDVETGTQAGIITGDNEFLALAWSPDGDVLASSSWSGGIDLWEAATGRNIGRLGESFGYVDELAWSSMLASSGEDSIVRVWDVEAAEALWHFEGHQGEITCLVWSPDDTRLGSCGEEDSTLRVWTIPTDESSIGGQRPATMRLGKHTSQESSEGPDHLQLAAHEYGVYDMAWSPDGQLIATAGGDNAVRLWEAESGRQIDLLLDIESTVVDLTWLTGGERLIVIGADGTLRLVNVTSRQVELSLRDHTSSMWSITWSPDGTRLASAGSDSTVRIWDTVAGTIVQSLESHTYGLRSVAWSPNGAQLATSGEDGFVRIWETDEWWPSQEWEFEEDVISALAWSWDSTQLAMADVNGQVQIWNVADGQTALNWQAHEVEINDLTWSPDGRQLATSALDGTVGIWQAGSGQEVRLWQAHEDEAKGLAWSPDGQQLASSSFDQTVRIWDVNSGQQLRQLTGHDELVVDVAWSPNGELLASVGWDNQVRLWQTSNGRPLNQLAGHVSAVLSAVWSPAGDLVATSGDDGTIRLWGLEP